MLITSVSVEGVGRFQRMTTVRGLGAGVNVLAAANEAGKSTLFRAIRACLFKKHDSRDQDVRDLASSESQLPATVVVTFEQNGHSYEIRKSFLRSASATLSENGREIARGRQADEKVWELFGVEAGSGRSIDDGAFGVLWVGQGKSIAVPTIAGKADSLLSAAIEAEVGSLIGGERARSVMSNLSTQISSYLTDTGRTRADGPLGLAERELNNLRTTETDLVNRTTTLDEHFTNLGGLAQERMRLGDPAAISQAAGELAEAERLFKQGQEAAVVVKNHEALERAAHAKLETATQRLRQLGEIIDRIDQARIREAELVSQLSGFTDREQQARDKVEGTKAQIVSVESELETLDQRGQVLQRLAAAATKAHNRADAAKKLSSLEDAVTRLVKVNAEHGLIKVTAAALRNIEEIEKQQAALQVRLAAAAPQLVIEIQKGGLGQVKLGEDVVEARFKGPIIDPATISITGIATITVTPALADAKAVETKRGNLEDEMRSALWKAGVASSAEAGTAMARRRDLEAQRQGIRAELTALGAEQEDATTLISELKEQIAGADIAVLDALTHASLSKLPSEAEIEAEQATLKTQRDECQRTRAKFAGVRNAEDEALEQTVAARSGADAELGELRRTLQADLNICPDADREQRLGELSQAANDVRVIHEQTAAALAAQRRVAPDQTELERLNIRCKRLREQTENRDKRLRELEGEIGRLEGHIQHAGGDGIGELLAGTQELREIAEREVSRISSRLDAVRLLHDTVNECLAEGQDRYFAPVRRHLRPFLNDLFPGAELQLGEGFEIAGIKRGSEEPFNRLSDGTKEQIAVLVRLAMGAMLAERSQVLPIVLDDALVFSDDQRIQRMFDALSRAGQQQQVIVLTCRMKVFEQLGGRNLRIESAA